MLLVDFLRDLVRLTGTHVGCDTSNCGACTVILNGRSIKSCTYLAVAAEGQVYGAIGHQLGAALYERLIYDESGQLVTSSFKDYCAPTALDFPKFEVDYLDTPSLATPWGARGVGEGGGSP